MNELGIRSRVRRKKFRSYQGEVGEAAPNLLNREFTASGPNEKWVTDVTEFRVAGKNLYLSPVMDLYNGEIVAYQSSHRPDFPMVMGMLKKAVRKRGNAATPMLHSDQGWHYRMQPYRAALARYGMKQSMSRKGNCFDNAAMESFFGTLKAEYFHLTDFRRRRVTGRPEGLHRLLQPAPHQIETWWTESRGISNASGKKLTLQRPTLGGQSNFVEAPSLERMEP